MNLEDLRAAQVDERSTDSLQALRPSFYADAADYLADLRQRRDRLADRADDPFDSAEVRQLTDELETAEEVVEAIYERRVGKLVKRASLAAAGVPTDEDGLTDEERALFADLVERIETHRATVLDAFDAEVDSRPRDETRGGPAEPATDPAESDPSAPADAGSTPDASTDPADESSTADPADPAPDGGAAAGVPAEEPTDPAGTTDRVTVRIIADVGEIYGVDDRVYTLGDEDVVTLPSANATPLLERGAAQRLD